MGQFLTEQRHKMVKFDKPAVFIKTITVLIVNYINFTTGSPLNVDMLDINREPGMPYIMQVMEEEMLEGLGKEVELQCVSEGGNPPAEIQWWDGEGRKIMSDVTEHVTRIDETNMFKTISSVKIKVSEYSVIKCSAHNEVFPAGRMSDSVELGREDPADVVQIKEIEEGDSVKIICQRRENTRFNRFKWFINDVEIFDEDQNVLELQKFAKTYDNSIVKCFTEDVIGELNLVKAVRLKHKEKHATNTLLSNLVHNSIVQKSKSKGRKSMMKKRRMLICEMGDESSEEPNQVYFDKSLNKVKSSDMIIGTNKKNKYKCKMVVQGTDIINKMSQDLSSITKSLNQISITLDEFNRNFDEDDEVSSHKSFNIPL